MSEDEIVRGIFLLKNMSCEFLLFSGKNKKKELNCL
jgi:hypothetical protein